MNLNQYKSNRYSQNGEDGLLDFLVDKLPDANKICIEFGAGDGKTNSNTLKLIEDKEYTGYFIEGYKEHYDILLENSKKFPNKIIPINCYIDHNDGENSLDNVLTRAGLTEINPDVMSIDIDGLDYRVWQRLKVYNPKIVIIEINSGIDFNQIFSEEELSDEKLIARGSNFATMVDLGTKKGYTFVIHTGNCIFIRNDYMKYFLN